MTKSLTDKTQPNWPHWSRLMCACTVVGAGVLIVVAMASFHYFSRPIGGEYASQSRSHPSLHLLLPSLVALALLIFCFFYVGYGAAIRTDKGWSRGLIGLLGFVGTVAVLTTVFAVNYYADVGRPSFANGITCKAIATCPGTSVDRLGAYYISVGVLSTVGSSYAPISRGARQIVIAQELADVFVLSAGAFLFLTKIPLIAREPKSNLSVEPNRAQRDSRADEIKKLADLHGASSITDEEFAELKAKVCRS